MNLINLDWLQFFAVGEPDFEGYEIEKEPYQTRHFKTIEQISYKGEHLFCVARHPHSPLLNPGMVLIKVINRYLYATPPGKSLKKHLESLHLKIRSISRLDVCMDFQQLVGYSNPGDLLSDVATKALLYAGRKRMTLTGTFSINHDLHYLRAGSSSSSICFYMYNKTKEMTDCTRKPYIIESWAAAGYDPNLPVWRIEFSIKDSRLKLVDMTAGEMITISKDSILRPAIMCRLFYSLLKQYFTFRINDGKANISRMQPYTPIFREETTDVPYITTDHQDSTKMDKFFIHKLETLNAELREIRNPMHADVEQLIQYYHDTRAI
jgi:hypothetical protein